jgi:biotin operon repressor
MNTRDTLSSSARAVLTAAARREDCRAFAPDLPAAAQRAVLRSLLQRGLLKNEGDILHITSAGLSAIGVPVPAAARAGHINLHSAARAAVAAWEAGTGLEEVLTSLQSALNVPRSPRANTKRAQVLALLRRPEGVSGPQISEATGWASHTVRGFLAGLQRQGSKIEVLQRVRQSGPGKEGARGSYSIYRLVGEA